MKSTSLFPTLIYHQPLWPAKLKAKGQKLMKDLEREVEVLVRDDVQGREWSAKNYRHGFTSYGSQDRLFDISPTFAELKKTIDRHCVQYLRDLKFNASPRELHMNTLWANVMPPGSYHTGHIHPHSVISGTFYLRTPRPLSPLKFEDPRLNLFMNSPVRPDCFVHAKAKAGDVVLFESWLRHEVPENTATSPRISLSFNYDWKSDAAL